MTVKSNKMLSIYVKGLLSRIPPPKKKPFIGEKMGASLLLFAIEQGVIKVDDKKNLLLGLDSKSKKDVYLNYLESRKNQGLRYATHLEMSTFLTYIYPEKFSWIMRDPKSGEYIWNLGEDIMFVLVTDQKPLFPREEKDFRLKHNWKIGKICYISNVNGSFQTNKGGSDMLNQCYHNYPFFPQEHTCIISREHLTKIWPDQKERLLRHTNDYLYHVYKLYFVMSDPHYHLEPKYYLKKSLRECIINTFSEEIALNELELIIKRTLSNYKPRFGLEYGIRLDPDSLENTTIVEDSLFRSFIRSPIRPNQSFSKKWMKTYGTEDIGIQFAEKCIGVEHFTDMHFPGEKNRVLDIGLRTQEWIDLYNSDTYQTGRNSGLKPVHEHDDYVKTRYNLIRGNFGEAIVFQKLRDIIQSLNIINGHDFSITTPSMILEDGPGSRSFCPDAIVYNKDCVLPVEIKTIVSTLKPDREHRREFELARLQIWGTVKVVNRGKKYPVARKGLGLFLFISPIPPYTFTINYHIYDFKPEELYFSE